MARIIAASDRATLLVDRALKLPRFRAALAKTLSGQGNTRIYMPGDSKTMGRGAGANGLDQANIAGARPFCTPLVFGKLLGQRLGLEVNTDSIHGLHGTSIRDYPLYDTRVSIGADIVQGNVFSAGGDLLRFNAGTTGKYALTPVIAFDKFEIVCFGSSGNGVLAVSIDGGSTVLGTIDCNKTTTQMFSTTFTVAKGNHTISVYYSSGTGPAFMQSIIPYDSTKSVIQILLGGSSGSVSSNWSQSASVYQPSSSGVSILAPHLTIYAIGTNDKTAGTATSATKANIQTFANKVLQSSDLVLCCPTMRSTDTTQQIADMRTMFKELGSGNSCLVIDDSARFGTYAASSALGFWLDSVHETKAGYADLALSRVEALIA